MNTTEKEAVVLAYLDDFIESHPEKRLIPMLWPDWNVFFWWHHKFFKKNPTQDASKAITPNGILKYKGRQICPTGKREIINAI
jgi:hypothetical protein